MTKNDNKDTPQENPSEMDDDLESLSMDEKAAFEKIMAEISETGISDSTGDNGANKTVAEAKTAEQPKPQTKMGREDAELSKDQDLSDEQQAGLDKIMTEINAGESGDPSEPEPAKDDQPADNNEQLSDDQQAALDKIMAEINARESGKQAIPEPVQEKQSADDDNDGMKEKPENEIEKLSFDEFNEELNNLLCSTQQNASMTEIAAASSQTSSAKSVAVKPASALEPESAPRKNEPVQPAPANTEASAGAPPEEAQAPPAEPTQKGYPILQEIDATQIGKTKSKKARIRGDRWRPRLGKFIKIATATVVTVAMAGSAYWAYDRLVQGKLRFAGAENPLNIETSSVGSAPTQLLTEQQSRPLVAKVEVENTGQVPQQQSLTTFGSLKSDLIAARQKINTKIQEIIDLKSHYQKGIQEEQFRIRAELKIKPARTLEIARTNSQIDLSIRAIQRRMVYITKLDTPLRRLEASSEDLLYLERRTQFFETLSQWISGPSIPEYKQEIVSRIQAHMKVTTELTVDDIQINPPSITSIWADVQAGMDKNENSIATDAKRNDQDLRISQEICKGQYDRKYLLNALSVETAQCLTQWSGKDLYLNGLTELSPQAAKILAQWPGEWLSLNGIKELSVETAKYLSQWHGKRLSLNGLEKLSAKATIQLSRWQGEQLEMIGLTTIGRWENYATRLYLSETLRRKLQM
jgi:hypothetical protein